MDKIILIILLVVAVVLGIIFSMVFYNRGKQKIEDKYEKLGKDASKIIDDAEREGQAQKKELLREGKEELEKSKDAFNKEVASKKAELQEVARKLDVVKQV